MKSSSYLLVAALTIPALTSVWVPSTTFAAPSAGYPGSKPTPKPTPGPAPTPSPTPQPDTPPEAEKESYIRKGTIYGKITYSDATELPKDGQLYVNVVENDPTANAFSGGPVSIDRAPKSPVPYDGDWLIDPYVAERHDTFYVLCRLFQNDKLTHVSKAQILNPNAKWQRFDFKLVPASAKEIAAKPLW